MPVPVAGGSLDRGDENEPGRRSAAKLLTKDEARRLLFRDGRIALLIGLGFLFCCTLLRRAARNDLGAALLPTEP